VLRSDATSNGSQTRKVVDVVGASHDNGANVQLYESNGTNAQRWKIVVRSDGTCTIQNVASGKYLDVPGGKAFAGANVQQWEGNGSNAQRWYAYLIGSSAAHKTVSFASYLNSIYVLDLSGANTADGANIQIWNENGTPAQSWEMYQYSSNGATTASVPASSTSAGSIASGFVTIANRSNGKVVDIVGASTADGATAQGYDSNLTLAQGYSLQKLGSYYRIVNLNSGKALAVANGDLIPGAPIVQSAISGAASQLWSLIGSASSLSIVSRCSGLYLNLSGSVLSALDANGSNGQAWKLSTYSIPTIANGSYSILSGVGGGKALDVSGGSIASGANVQIYDSNGTYAQRWYVTRSNGSYYIRNIASGLYLMESGTNVCQGATRFSWSPSYVIGVGYSFVSPSGRVVDVLAGSSANGTNVQTYASNGTRAQGWTLSACDLVDAGYVQFAAGTNSNLRLDISAGSAANGANVQLWQANGSDAQTWYLVSLGGGYFGIRSCVAASSLDVDNGVNANGTNVQQWATDGSVAQKWRFSFGENGLQIISAVGGRVLDAAGGGTANGTNAWIWSNNGTAAQGWHIMSASVAGFRVRVQNFVNNMVNMANDDSHGYDQDYRWGERGDYDCSSLVISCLRWAGYDTGGASYTGDMRSNLVARGWEWISSFSTSDLQAGDILLNEGEHTAAMINSTQLAQASGNEWGGIEGGQPGDQTGHEINIHSYWDDNWGGILRATERCALA
jgi:hypothetical protein